MSSIIDDLLFCSLKKKEKNTLRSDHNNTTHNVEEFVKKIQFLSNATVVTSNTEIYQVSIKQKIQNQEYYVRNRVEKHGKFLKVEARLLENCFFKKFGTKQSQILLMKQIAAWQFINGRESVFYINRGTLMMSQQIYFSLSEKIRPLKMTQFYHMVINRNLYDFGRFINKYSDDFGNILMD